MGSRAYERISILKRENESLRRKVLALDKSLLKVALSYQKIVVRVAFLEGVLSGDLPRYINLIERKLKR